MAEVTTGSGAEFCPRVFGIFSGLAGGSFGGVDVERATECFDVRPGSKLFATEWGVGVGFAGGLGSSSVRTPAGTRLLGGSYPFPMSTILQVLHAGSRFFNNCRFTRILGR